MNFFIQPFRFIRSFLVALSVASVAYADTIYFDNSSSPLASASFISASVSQVVRFKTDVFSGTDTLSFVDLWVGQVNIQDGLLPVLTIYNDVSGALGSVLESAQFNEAPANTSPGLPAQQVRVDFSGTTALASESYYWIGMGFAPGSTGSLGWSTSLQTDLTSLAFITAGGVNYVGTNNMPNVKIVGSSAASVPESGAVALYVLIAFSCLAIYRQTQLKINEVIA